MLPTQLDQQIHAGLEEAIPASVTNLVEAVDARLLVGGLLVSLVLFVLRRGGARALPVLAISSAIVVVSQLLLGNLLAGLYSFPAPQGPGMVGPLDPVMFSAFALAVLWARAYPELRASTRTMALMAALFQLMALNHWFSAVMGGALVGAVVGLVAERFVGQLQQLFGVGVTQKSQPKAKRRARRVSQVSQSDTGRWPKQDPFKR